MPDPSRSYRASDALYNAASDLASSRDLGRPRSDRDGLGGVIRLALRAFLANPDEFEAACRELEEAKP